MSFLYVGRQLDQITFLRAKYLWPPLPAPRGKIQFKSNEGGHLVISDTPIARPVDYIMCKSFQLSSGLEDKNGRRSRRKVGGGLPIPSTGLILNVGAAMLFGATDQYPRPRLQIKGILCKDFGTSVGINDSNRSEEIYSSWST